MSQRGSALPATRSRASAVRQRGIPGTAAAAVGTGPLAILSEQDRQLFRRFGYGPAEPTGSTHIQHAIEQWAVLTPDTVAVEHLDERITYRQLDQQADRLAARLIAHGIRPGDRVGVFMRRSIPMVVGILATLKTGAAYVPQHAGVATEAHLRHVTETAEIRIVLTSTETVGELPHLPGRMLIAVDELLAEPLTESAYPVVPAGLTSPDDGCYVLFTSGTTGRPNGVTVTHRNVCNLLLTAPGDLGIQPGWRVGQILNIAFDMAAWEILGCLSHGGTLVVRGRDIAATVETVDVVVATPSVLGTVDPDRCRRVKVVAVAGEPCPRELADRWARQAVFYNGCGPTETTIVNTMHRHDPASERLTIGRPTPNNTVYVLDADRRPCAIGEVGEMWAGGDCVSVGYLGDPELTGQRYVPDPFLGGGRMMFRTRDLGRWTPDGELEHLGRTDDQVKVRGFRVELDSVSAVLEAVPGCRRAATIKVDDRTLVSFVAPATVDPTAARDAVARTLPYYCVPERVHALGALPVTDRGKIDKAALRRSLDRPTPSDPPAPLLWARRILSHPRLMPYHRLAALVLVGNAALLYYALTTGGWWRAADGGLANLSYAALANVALAVLIRQQYMINLLFWLATRAPTRWPLRVRWGLGKVYHFGGLHVGGALAGTAWFAGYVAELTRQALADRAVTAVLVLSYLLVALLLAMVATALPPVRGRRHDLFERVHRFGGWAALILLWAQTVLVVDGARDGRPMAAALLGSPALWTLALLTVSVALPWLRLRRVPVQMDRPSNHVALLTFGHTTPFAGSSTAISRRPLLEWHSFANVPAPGERGFRLTVSRAGDWTGALIDDLPNRIWVKGITTAGVANIETLFTRVVYVATGSGIGPVLPHLLAGKVPAHLVWSTRSPRTTYGDELVDEILRVQPDATIWDTARRGKPDMVALALQAWRATGAEAVICIANQKLTRQVVHGLERRGIPAYGAIWDS